jgi:hypothetical protein
VEEGQPVVEAVGKVAVEEQLVAAVGMQLEEVLQAAVQVYTPAGQVVVVAKRILYVLRMQ